MKKVLHMGVFHLSIIFMVVVTHCSDLNIKPNIVFIVADDLGYGDIGARTHGIRTPHLDGMMRDGIALTNYYVLSSCSPTRAAFMTGRYPIRYGVNAALYEDKPQGVPLTETFLPEVMKGLGYATHAIGKWHLGHHMAEHTPTFRGFDTFFGSYGGSVYYFNYSAPVLRNLPPDQQYYDLHREEQPRCGIGCTVMEDYQGMYSTQLFSREATLLIEKHDRTRPFFLYLAFQAVHQPVEAPYQYTAQYEGQFEEEKRRTFAGMLTALDEGVGNVTRKLKELDMLRNTFIVFTTDNGGPTDQCGTTGSSNWPLRGGKCTVWEGGTRATGFICGKGVPQELIGTQYKGLMHAVDWLPTLAHLAGATREDMPHAPLDGVDHWLALTLKDGIKAPRTEIFYGFGNSFNMNGAALKLNQWKLIVGNAGQSSWSPPWNQTLEEWEPVNQDYLAKYGGHQTHALYNLENDPMELTDMSATYPEIVNILTQHLKVYLSYQAKHVLTSHDHTCGLRNEMLPIGPHGMKALTPWCQMSHLMSEGVAVPASPNASAPESAVNTTDRSHVALSKAPQLEDSRKQEGSDEPSKESVSEMIHTGYDSLPNASTVSTALEKGYESTANVSSALASNMSEVLQKEANFVAGNMEEMVHAGYEALPDKSATLAKTEAVVDKAAGNAAAMLNNAANVLDDASHALKAAGKLLK